MSDDPEVRVCSCGDECTYGEDGNCVYSTVAKPLAEWEKLLLRPEVLGPGEVIVSAADVRALLACRDSLVANKLDPKRKSPIALDHCGDDTDDQAAARLRAALNEEAA